MGIRVPWGGVDVGAKTGPKPSASVCTAVRSRFRKAGGLTHPWLTPRGWHARCPISRACHPRRPTAEVGPWRSPLGQALCYLEPLLCRLLPIRTKPVSGEELKPRYKAESTPAEHMVVFAPSRVDCRVSGGSPCCGTTPRPPPKKWCRPNLEFEQLMIF